MSETLSSTAPYSKNILQTIQDIAARLDDSGVAFGHGTWQAFDEAAWLVLWCLGIPLDSDDVDLEERQVSADEFVKIEDLLAKRISSRKPLAYLTGEIGRASCRERVCLYV